VVVGLQGGTLVRGQDARVVGPVRAGGAWPAGQLRARLPATLILRATLDGLADKLHARLP